MFAYWKDIIPPLVERGLYCNHLRPSVRSHFRNRYLSFYWKKWLYIWYMALAWLLVPCLPFPGLPHIYFLFTMWLTNERVGVFLARHSVQHLVNSVNFHELINRFYFDTSFSWRTQIESMISLYLLVKLVW